MLAAAPSVTKHILPVSATTPYISMMFRADLAPLTRDSSPSDDKLVSWTDGCGQQRMERAPPQRGWTRGESTVRARAKNTSVGAVTGSLV